MNVPLRKRVFDIAASLTTAPIWLLVLLTCMGLQFILEGRPIFYTSSRRVYRNRQARVVKFRTMIRDAARLYNRDTVPVQNQRFLNTPINSPLYTGFGRFMERCQFTELPQVLHVLAGTLSIVGNRPLPENVIASLKEVFPHTEERFASPAGLTGLVQLIGRESLSDAARLDLERRYCHCVDQSYSVWMDFRILLYTVLIHAKLMQAFDVEDAHRFLDRYGPRLAMPSIDATAATSANDDKLVANA